MILFFWFSVIGHLVISYWSLVIGYWSLVIGYWLLVISLLVIGHWLLVIPTAIDILKFIAELPHYCQLSIVSLSIGLAFGF
jgi:hypothetical protein